MQTIPTDRGCYNVMNKDIAENDLFSRLGNVARDCYFAFNAVDNELLYVGRAIYAITGLDEVSLQRGAESIWEIVHPEDRAYVRDALNTLFESKSVQAEFRILNGEQLKYIQFNAYVIEADLIAGNISDITILKNNIFYAEKINARKNAMLGVLAHDLKEPVAIINMMASAIKNNPAVKDNEDILTNIKVIQQLCDRNITLIKDLMNKEFLEAPEVGLRKERTCMNNALADILKQYQNSEKVIERSFYFEQPDAHVYATIDMFKVAQCVNNLIVNAIKFTADGGQIVLKLTEQADTIKICVEDNGIGIPADLHPYLFDERTIAHRPGLRGEHGYGMGLSIIRLLVEFHGGKVWAESTESVGSTFCIELPKGL